MPSTTYVVFMDMAAYSDSTEIFLNSTQATSPVSPGSFNSTYEHLIPGAYDVKFDVAGTDSVLADIPSSAYDSSSFYTVILYNDDTTSRSTKAIKLFDDFSQVSGNNTYYRFLDFCPSLSGVDVYLNQNKQQQSRTSADLVANPPLFAAFQAITPNTYSIQLKKAGTDTVLLSSYDIDLAAGNAYTIVVGGRVGSSTFPPTLSVIRAAY